VKPPESNIDLAMEEFARLSSADQRAIARHLSDKERKALARIASSEHPQPSPRSKERLVSYSPWLAKRLRRLVNPRRRGGEDGVTPATQRILADLLARQPAR
jgi:hypothetical protein